MHESENTKTVQEMYAAFSKGDIQFILDRLADDVMWHGVYGAGSHVPFSGAMRGKAAVGTFFQNVGNHMTFSRFEPREFIATGDKVVALGHYVGTSSVKKSFDSDFAMVFTLQNGKVTKFQEFTDSAAVDRAFQA